MSQQRGYILFLTFSILALCAALISAFMVKAITHKKLTLALLEQNEFEQFSFSTPALAQSFLAFSTDEIGSLEEKTVITENVPSDDKKEQETKKLAAEQLSKKLLEKVLPVVNTVQKFNLKEIDEDLSVIVNLTFFCESGKININGFYDLENKKFHNEGVQGKDCKLFLQWLFDKIASITGKPSLFEPFVEHLKQRKSPFNDVTELLGIKEFTACFENTIFYGQNNQIAPEDITKPQIFLTDIFTVSSEHDRIQPWLLSPSVCVLLDIVQTSSKEEESEKKEDKKVDLTSFKIQADWLKDWDTSLKKIYGVSFDKIPEQIKCMLATEFSANVFSVLIEVKKQIIASENNMMVRIFAILKQRKLPDNSITYDVIKIYQV